LKNEENDTKTNEESVVTQTSLPVEPNVAKTAETEYIPKKEDFAAVYAMTTTTNFQLVEKSSGMRVKASRAKYQPQWK
jgi:hypothetical protein